MSNDKVRPDGYYLVRWGEDDELSIEDIWGGQWWDERREEGTLVEEMDFYWIADEPLDLESIRLIHEADYDCTCDDGRGWL
jgi:hypothetical protein